MGTEFGSIASIFRASAQQLSAVPGLGPTKVKRLHDTFSTPFFKDSVVSGTTQAKSAERGAAQAEASARGAAATDTSSGSKDAAGEQVVLDEAERDAREWLATQTEPLCDPGSDSDDSDFV